MKNQIILSVSFIRRLLLALPGHDQGRIVFPLGDMGYLEVHPDRMKIGSDQLDIPVNFLSDHDSDTPVLSGTLVLTGWRVSDHGLCFSITRLGRITGMVLNAMSAVIVMGVNKRLKGSFPGSRLVTHERGRIWVPFDTLHGILKDYNLLVHISGISLEYGIIITIK